VLHYLEHFPPRIDDEHIFLVGIIAAITVEPEPVPRLVKRFSDWMRQDRGVTEGTLTIGL
jgi:hypothetical protein